MILVVALLGILFVAGVAFLQSVTFQSKAIQAETDTREDEALVDAVEDLVVSAMTRSWMGEDGVPYSGAGKLLYEDPSSPGTLKELQSWSNYGEPPGDYPLLAEIEPYEGDFQGNAEVMVWGAHTDLRLLTAGQLVPQHNAELLVDVARPNWDKQVGAIDIYLDNSPDDLVDADGDGIADSVGVTLSLLDLIPSAQWDETVNRLRAPDGTTDNITVGVRVVSHSGMINPNYSHPLLLDEGWNDSLPLIPDGLGDPKFAPGRYAPEIEEQALRHRNLVPSRTLPDTLLQRDLRTRLFADVSPLVGMFEPRSSTTGNFTDHRWWPFDPAAEEVVGGGPFRQLMNPMPSVADPYVVTAAARYDRRHLTTTISYDDLLIRGVQFPAGHPAAGEDVVEWMKADPDRRKVFRLDNYPYRDDVPSLRLAGASLDDENAGLVGLAIDGRVGRIQLSLPFLDDWLAHEGTSLNGLSSLADTDPRKQQFIRMIQDMFWVMLWNCPDFNRDGSYAYDSGYAAGSDDFERAVTAASLTANLIDFADSDDEPTAVMAVDENGNSLDRETFGVERQPFITEVVSIMPGEASTGTPLPDHANIIYAVELFNPYVTTLPVPANRYKIVFNDPPKSQVYDVPQIASGIPAGGFVTLFATDDIGAGASLPPGAVNLGNLPVFTPPFVPFGPNTVVDLLRTVGAIDIVIDRFDVSQGAPVEFGNRSPSASIGSASIQRDVDPADPLRRWRAVVPIVGPEDTSAHTLNAANTYVNVNIRPVQADVVNAGSLADAYPTTGTLLLLMRHAHVYDTTTVPATSTPFNQAGATSTFPTDLASRFDQVDNGRMPVFDVGVLGKDMGGDGDGTTGSAPYYHKSAQQYSDDDGLDPGFPHGPETLPWGLLVFDYFTALPLETDPADFEQLMYSIDYPPSDYLKPKVDQAGLRVYGRININVAPWKVLTGLPLIPAKDLPGAPPSEGGAAAASFYDKLKTVYPTGIAGWFNKCQTALGWQAARAIVAYRDALNNVPVGCAGDACPGDFRDRTEGPLDPPTTPYIAGMRQGKGFLSVGELANVRHPDRLTDRPIFRIDNGAVGRGVAENNPTEDYVDGVALLVALGDWVTTRSHVFTIYGTIRGDGSDPTEVDRRAIRFETTVDRLPTFFDHKASPQRIGQRTIGRYLEARAD